ncbi:dynein axonemal assembly factor 19 isoform X1 [Pelodiscus sinensis]|uniref:dynein axonemal assembly factor 19 isoform X1 n=1 Tax=Pelodiscus sinensis TaxID=13735 RepID=UPI003F6B9E9C
MEEAEAIDFCALERELQAAVAADEKYQRENDAKFRAVHQKVASYEEFRDIVLASHLKPLEKKDKMGKKKNLLWNSYATQAKCKQDGEMELAQGWDGLPETSADFYRYWRRCLKSGQERYRFLCQLGGEPLGRIFQAEVGFGLLGEFLVVLAEHICGADRAAVLQILQGLCGTKRFGLNVALLSQGEKDSCRDLFGKLQHMGRIRGAEDLPEGPAEAGAAALQEERNKAERETHLNGSGQRQKAADRLIQELVKCYCVS